MPAGTGWNEAARLAVVKREPGRRVD
jgi:hypothetical protein